MTEGTPAGPALLRLTLRAEPDVFLVRQRGREVAAAVGLEHQDQVRLATALSEIGRYLVVTLPTPARAEVAFTVAVEESGAVLVTEATAVLPPARRHRRSPVPCSSDGWSTPSTSAGTVTPPSSG
ncbi:hypothetical protein [Plantactinospora veratri]